MPKKTEGCVINRTDRPGLWARVTYSDNFGRRRVIQRRVATKTEGKLLLKKLLNEVEERGAQIIEGDRLTFAKLAQAYEKKRLFEPTITPSGKTIGLKSYYTLKRRLKTLTTYFGNRLVKTVSHNDIEEFKRERLATPPARRNTAHRSETDVNRDLQLLRNIFNFALRQGWVRQNPFSLGEPLISIAAEPRRERVLSREEEVRLLEACAGPRAHLRPILICALDTAMRRGEMFQLRWRDVDLMSREINVRATTTKTGKGRVVPISSRLHEELMRLFELSPDDPDGRVFGISNSIKNGFSTICKIAQVEDFRLHDCRHSAITRWIQQGLPAMQVMAISGHTQMQTFSRYVNADKTALRRAAQAMDEFQSIQDYGVEQRSVN